MSSRLKCINSKVPSPAYQELHSCALGWFTCREWWPLWKDAESNAPISSGPLAPQNSYKWQWWKSQHMKWDSPLRPSYVYLSAVVIFLALLWQSWHYHSLATHAPAPAVCTDSRGAAPWPATSLLGVKFGTSYAIRGRRHNIEIRPSEGSSCANQQ